MSADRPSVVFNCNVLLQAMISDRGPAWRCYQFVEENRVTMYVSPHVLYELRKLPGRVRTRRFKSLTVERVERFIRELLGKSTLISEVPTVFTYARDADDAGYVNLALAAGARFIVTRDRDLLALMDSTSPAGEEFQQRFPTLRIVNPVEFLAEVGPPED